jgi:Toprim domain
MSDFGQLMRQVAPLLGYDPRVANPKGVGRYRSHGSMKIDFSRGTFSDFETGVAGGVLDFIRVETGQDPRDWLKHNHINSPKPAMARPGIFRRKEDHGAERRDFTADELERIADARTIWDQAQPIDGVQQVAGYLAARGGLDVTGCKAELRYTPTTAWENQWRPCLLAAYRSLDTDEITGVSRILVDEPERWPKTQRKMLGVVRRAAIKLAPITDVLAVAEGLETAIAANMLGHGPAWAVGSAGAVANLPVLPGIERLILIAENDESGASRKATDRCGTRWLQAGRKVTRIWPEQGCSDLNDELISRGKPNGHD